MNELIHRLAEARLTNAELDAAWPAEDRAALLDLARDKAANGGRRPRRRGAWLAAAAAIAAVVVLLPVLTGGDAQARADILRLASVALDAEKLTFTPGAFLHVKTESVQRDSRIFGDGQTLDTDREAWVRWDGAQWAVDSRPSAGWTSYNFFAAPTTGSFSSPSRQFVAQLPDGSAELRKYLDSTVTGSNSHDEAVFVAVTDLAHSHLLDPATFAVALKAIADVSGVQTKDVVVEGRDAVEISYRPFHLKLLGVDSITIDKETAQVLRVASSSPGGTYTSTTTLLQVERAIPARVLAAYARYGGNGDLICADGREAVGDGAC